MRLKSVLLILLSCVIAVDAQEWHPDVLGDGYMMRYVDQGCGERSTIVRKTASEADGYGVLYIHGFNDYFFQKEMGDMFVSHHYDFYAVDLRRYGRSLQSGERPFDTRNLKDYFPDIDSAIVTMKNAGIDRITLIGHSTGGLIAAYYMSKTRNKAIDALILNSPFLDWNLGKMEKLIPLVSFWGELFPKTNIKQGKSQAYSESLLKNAHGEWDYDTVWKLKQSPDVTAGWVHAITSAQRALRGGKARIDVPVLLMYSSKSVGGDKWTPEHNRGDGVLDVSDIKKYGRQLGPDVTSIKVVGGMHDLVLSSPGVRYPLYDYIFEWMRLNVRR